MNSDARELIKKLHSIADEYFQRVMKENPNAFHCKPGCCGCCKLDFSVFLIEADIIYDALPNSILEMVKANLKQRRYCVFLDHEKGLCLIYPTRPIICRTHGMAVLLDKKVSWCPLNYQTTTPKKTEILDITKLNTLLSQTVLMDGRSKRVNLSTIAKRWISSRVLR